MRTHWRYSVYKRTFWRRSFTVGSVEVVVGGLGVIGRVCLRLFGIMKLLLFEYLSTIL